METKTRRLRRQKQAGKWPGRGDWGENNTSRCWVVLWLFLFLVRPMKSKTAARPRPARFGEKEKDREHRRWRPRQKKKSSDQVVYRKMKGGGPAGGPPHSGLGSFTGRTCSSEIFLLVPFVFFFFRWSWNRGPTADDTRRTSTMTFFRCPSRSSVVAVKFDHDESFAKTTKLQRKRQRQERTEKTKILEGGGNFFLLGKNFEKIKKQNGKNKNEKVINVAATVVHSFSLLCVVHRRVRKPPTENIFPPISE